MISGEPKRPFVAQLGRWLAELILVFLGAYAAFWLDGYQQHQEDAKRRDQNLAALEEEANESIADAQRGLRNRKRESPNFAEPSPPVRRQLWNRLASPPTTIRVT